MIEELQVTTTNNGTQLFVTGFSKVLNDPALSKLGEDYRVFLAKTTDGYKSYILIKGQEVVHDDQSFEGLACHIDFMKMARDSRKQIERKNNMTKFEKLVKDLGKKSPNGIAKLLENEGIKGIIDKSTSCPINGFLARKLKVNHNNISVGVYNIWLKQKVTKTPENVKSFIHDFDSGVYPNLIKE
jgi:hypothetical protein